jgi:hypothetical protein
MAHNCHQGKKYKLKHLHEIYLINTRKSGRKLEDPTRGGGGVQ